MPVCYVILMPVCYTQEEQQKIEALEMELEGARSDFRVSWLTKATAASTVLYVYYEPHTTVASTVLYVYYEPHTTATCTVLHVNYDPHTTVACTVCVL